MVNGRPIVLKVCPSFLFPVNGHIMLKKNENSIAKTMLLSLQPGARGVSCAKCRVHGQEQEGRKAVLVERTREQEKASEGWSSEGVERESRLRPCHGEGIRNKAVAWVMGRRLGSKLTEKTSPKRGDKQEALCKEGSRWRSSYVRGKAVMVR